MDIIFFDKKGWPVAYTRDSVHIYLWDGKPGAYLDGNLVYSFGGRHLGSFEDGWLRDPWGNCVFFTENATGIGPAKPVTSVKPIKGVERVLPVKNIREILDVSPVKTMDWLRLSGRFFKQL